jgi:hypothetical protein
MLAALMAATDFSALADSLAQQRVGSERLSHSQRKAEIPQVEDAKAA